MCSDRATMQADTPGVDLTGAREGSTDAGARRLHVVRLGRGVRPAEREAAARRVASAGCEVRFLGSRTLVVSGPPQRWLVTSGVADAMWLLDDPADSTTATRVPVTLGSHRIGAGHFTVIAGPCAVESRPQLQTIAAAVRASGAHALRGGAFKPRTSPHAFAGLGREALGYLAEARAQTGLPVVSEVVDVRDVEAAAAILDMVQIGARNMQNYPLLREAGRCGIPVLLKRGFGATIDETLLAAEYVLTEGNKSVVLCERGIRSFEQGYRFCLDLAAVTVLRERTPLPVLVDPSHAAGVASRVARLALAAAAVGADGLIVETHHDPAAALCDGTQALPLDELPGLMDGLALAAAASGLALVPPGTG